MSQSPVENHFSPTADRHRRVALGVSEGELASESGLTVEELRAYEARSAESYDVALHLRISQILDRFERRQKGLTGYGLI
jgi:transcriptional regulator with XRE-family HTH domain